MPKDAPNGNITRLMGLAVVSREICENLLANPEELMSKPIIYGSEQVQLNEAEKSLVRSVKGATTIEEFALELVHQYRHRQGQLTVPS